MDKEFIMNYSRGENNLIFSKSIQCSSAGQKPIVGGGGQNGVARQTGSPEMPSPPLGWALPLAATLPLLFPSCLETGKQCLQLTSPQTLMPSTALTTQWLSFPSTSGPALPTTDLLLILLWIKRCPVQPTFAWQSFPGGKQLGSVTFNETVGLSAPVPSTVLVQRLLSPPKLPCLFSLHHLSYMPRFCDPFHHTF